MAEIRRAGVQVQWPEAGDADGGERRLFGPLRQRVRYEVQRVRRSGRPASLLKDDAALRQRGDAFGAAQLDPRDQRFALHHASHTRAPSICNRKSGAGAPPK